MMLRMLGPHSPGSDFQVSEHAFNRDPDDGHRNQDLPAETHDLVVSVARERGAEPQETEQEEEQLGEQPMETIAQHRTHERHIADRGVSRKVTIERTEPA